MAGFKVTTEGVYAEEVEHVLVYDRKLLDRIVDVIRPRPQIEGGAELGICDGSDSGRTVSREINRNTIRLLMIQGSEHTFPRCHCSLSNLFVWNLHFPFATTDQCTPSHPGRVRLYHPFSAQRLELSSLIRKRGFLNICRYRTA